MRDPVALATGRSLMRSLAMSLEHFWDTLRRAVPVHFAFISQAEEDARLAAFQRLAEEHRRDR